jgi:hypothetical protein
VTILNHLCIFGITLANTSQLPYAIERAGGSWNHFSHRPILVRVAKGHVTERPAGDVRIAKEVVGIMVARKTRYVRGTFMKQESVLIRIASEIDHPQTIYNLVA